MQSPRRLTVCRRTPNVQHITYHKCVNPDCSSFEFFETEQEHWYRCTYCDDEMRWFSEWVYPVYKQHREVCRVCQETIFNDIKDLDLKDPPITLEEVE